MRTSVLLLCAALGVSCKGKPTTEDPPVQAGSAAAKPKPGDLQLPDRTTTPPNKTAKALTVDQMKTLGEFTFPGFGATGRVLNEKVMVVIHKTIERPTLAVGVTIRPCVDCIPMDLDKWKASPTINELLPEDLIKHADTHFESGMTDINGGPVVFTYQYGMNFSTDASGTHGTWSHAYILYFNDGINSIRIVAEYKDNPPGSIANLLKLIPRTELETVAKSFLDFYTHKWG